MEVYPEKKKESTNKVTEQMNKLSLQSKDPKFMSIKQREHFNLQKYNYSK